MHSWTQTLSRHLQGLLCPEVGWAGARTVVPPSQDSSQGVMVSVLSSEPSPHRVT